MNKYFSRAILYDRRFDLISIALSLLMINLLKIINYYRTYSINGNHHTELLFVNLNFIPIAFALTLSVTLYTKKESMYSNFLTQPQNRKTIIYTNLLIPILALSFSYLLYGIFASVVLFLTTLNLEIILHFGENLFHVIIIIIFVNSLSNLLQMLISNELFSMVGSIFSLLFIPLNVIFLGTIISAKFPFTNNLFLFFRNSFNQLIEFLGFNFNNSTSTLMINTELYSSPNVWLSIIVIILALIFSYLTIRLNEKLKVEDLKKVFIYSWVQKNLITNIVVFIYCFFTMFSEDILIKNFGITSDFIMLLLNLVLVPFAFILYKLLYKLTNKVIL